MASPSPCQGPHGGRASDDEGKSLEELLAEQQRLAEARLAVEEANRIRQREEAAAAKEAKRLEAIRRKEVP